MANDPDKRSSALRSAEHHEQSLADDYAALRRVRAQMRSADLRPPTLPRHFAFLDEHPHGPDPNSPEEDALKGSTYRRCYCRDPKTGKPLGKNCPKLHQPQARHLLHPPGTPTPPRRHPPLLQPRRLRHPQGRPGRPRPHTRPPRHSRRRRPRRH